MTTPAGPPAYTGITWDHPRGRHALEAAAALTRADTGLDLTWTAQPLEGFESHPIADLAARHDLVVLDHPHLGEAVASGCLRPLDELFDAETLGDWSREAVGASFASYTVAGRPWALPLDAATQVSARAPRRLEVAPRVWEEVADLARRLPVALSLAGPHAWLTLVSLCAALGSPVGDLGELGESDPGLGPDAGLVDTDTALAALELLAALGARIPSGSEMLNPIGLLEAIAAGELAYCPLVYGYVNYAGRGVAFADAPTARPGGPVGSVLGGTGIAVSARARVTPALIAHLRWLMSEQTQRGFIPQHDGQPSRRTAWTDPDVDHAAHGFYAATLATTESACVRPRYDGYIAFQTLASQHVRDVALGGTHAREGLRRLREAYRGSASTAPAVPILQPATRGA